VTRPQTPLNAIRMDSSIGMVDGEATLLAQRGISPRLNCLSMSKGATVRAQRCERVFQLQSERNTYE